MKKAFDRLNQLGLAYEFHDYKKQSIDAETVQKWLNDVGQNVILNKKGTTWRKLAPAVQAGVVDNASARALMLEHASVIKRPVVVKDQTVVVGVNLDAWARVVA